MNKYVNRTCWAGLLLVGYLWVHVFMVDHLAVDNQLSTTVIPGEDLLLPLFTAIITCS